MHNTVDVLYLYTISNLGKIQLKSKVHKHSTLMLARIRLVIWQQDILQYMDIIKPFYMCLEYHQVWFCKFIVIVTSNWILKEH